MNKKILSGSFWLSFGSTFSRVLGVVYLIPWLIMMGPLHNQNAAQALFNTAYTPYALFISLGTAGFPSAIARRVAILNSQRRYQNSKHVFKVTMLIMIVSGLVSGLLLYIFAPWMANNSPVTSVGEATTAIRILVPALVIIPPMSMVRGWFQGNQDMKPYGISQIWEQLFRIVFILLSTYIIIYVFHMSFVVAVYFSVFSAVIGSLASCAYLSNHYKNRRAEYLAREEEGLPKIHQDLKKIIFTIAYESVPFIIVGSGITLSQLVDQLFFKQILQNFAHETAGHAQYIYTLFSANPTKITTVVISLAIAIAETNLPLLASSNSKGNRSEVKKLLTDNMQLLLFILLPSIIILSILSHEIYGVFYSFDNLGSYYLVQNIIQSLFLGIAINGLTVLQSLHYSKKAMKYLIFGLVVKLVLQLPLVWAFGGTGAILATDLAFLVVILFSYRKLYGQFGVMKKKFRLNIFTNLLLLIVLLILNTGFEYLIGTGGRISAFIYASVFGLLSLLIYLAMANKFGLSERLFNTKINFKFLTKQLNNDNE